MAVRDRPDLDARGRRDRRADLAFARLADALAHLRRWFVVTSRVPLPTSDLGWQWLPGPSPGTLFVPTAPDTVLLVDGGPASYGPDTDGSRSCGRGSPAGSSG